MDIQTRKILFLQEFLKIQNEEILSLLEIVLKKNKPTTTLPEPMSIDEFNQRINKSMEDSKNGKFTESIDLKSEIEKWV